MAGTWLLALAPLAAQAFNCAAQLGSFRLLHIGLLRTVFIGFGAAMGMVAVLTAWGCATTAAPTGDCVGQIIANIAITGALGYVYFHFINLGETARRVRILREFVEEGGTLTEEKLLQRYNAAQIVRARLGRLLRSGQIICREGRYHIGNRAVFRMAGILRGLKRVLVGSGQFD